MIHEKFPLYFSSKDKTSEYKQILCQRASRIIAISQNTKNDLCDIFNIQPNKVEVVYLGDSLKKIKSERVKDIPQRYLLYVGSRSIYKNFSFLLKNISDIVKSENLYLVCVGGNNFTKDELKLIHVFNLERNITQLNAFDAELKYLYENAIALVFPSLYEGFGIPILEAFVCDCPVVCSNTSSLPEVAGDAALYFNPNNKESIRFAVERILSDEKLRQDLIQKGQERVKEFSWKKCAQETKKVYESILKK